MGAADVIYGDDLVPEYIQSRMVNWARWARAGARGQTCCAGPEGKYRAPADEDDERRTGKVEVDILDAEIVEDQWRGLPDPAKMILFFHYIRRVSEHAICRHLHVRRSEFCSTLRLAAMLLDRRVEAAKHDPDVQNLTFDNPSANLSSQLDPASARTRSM